MHLHPVAVSFWAEFALWYPDYMPQLRGMGASRSGRPTIGLQTIIDRLQANKPRRRHKIAEVSVEDAQQAVGVLERSRGRMGRYRDAMLAGAALKPVVRGVANAAEAAAAHSGKGRWGAALRGTAAAGKSVKGFTGAFNKPQLARDVVEGGLGGAVVNAGREGLELGRARRTAREFLQDEGPRPKTSAAKFQRGLSRFGERIQPVPTSKLHPIIDGDIDYEV